MARCPFVATGPGCHGGGHRGYEDAPDRSYSTVPRASMFVWDCWWDTPMARCPSWRQGRAITAEGTYCICLFSFYSTYTVH